MPEVGLAWPQVVTSWPRRVRERGVGTRHIFLSPFSHMCARIPDMPLRGVRYRVTQTEQGPVRLAFRGRGKVVEAKNLKTGAVHTPRDFARDRGRPKKLSGQAKRKRIG